MPRTKRLNDELNPQLAQEAQPIAPTTEEQTKATNILPGTIEDYATYEWGILIKDATVTGSVDSAGFSTARVGNWHGGSQSWSGALFRRTNRRAIKTFADFQAQNPLALPTNKTFFFFKITVDADGARKRVLVHEGTFSDAKPQLAPAERGRTAGQSKAPGVYLGDNVSGINTLHPASGESRSIREAMERTISDLQRELDVTRRERDLLREQSDKLRAENDANRDRIINIEGERIKHEITLSTTINAYEQKIKDLQEQHLRDIARRDEDYARDLADERRNAERSAIQTLNDGQSMGEKLMSNVSKLMDTINSPQFQPITQLIMGQLSRAMGGATQPTQSIPQIPPAVGGAGSNYLPNPFAQDLSQTNMPEAQYQTAEVGGNNG